jgi:hypothetical protein
MGRILTLSRHFGAGLRRRGEAGIRERNPNMFY